MQHKARIEAQKQWNKTTCGEVSGKKNTVECCLRVKRKHSRHQGWTVGYFEYNQI